MAGGAYCKGWGAYLRGERGGIGDYGRGSRPQRSLSLGPEWLGSSV